MNLEEKIKKRAKDDLEKVAKIKKWPSRITKLGTRKTARMSERQFCLKHGINAARFNRIKNLKDDFLPADTIMDAIEAALTAEGV